MDEYDRYTVYEDGECAFSTNDLATAIDVASHLFGKGYSDDITIWDNEEDEEVEIVDY